MANTNTVPLVSGEQVWELLATDKYGLSQDDLLSDKVHGLGVALDAILSQAKSGVGAPAPWQEIGTGDRTFRVGSARPVVVTSIAKSPPATPGKVLADRNAYPGEGIPTTVGTSPWYVTVKLWWRANDTAVPWPAFTSLFPALPDLEQVNGADWVLNRAIVPSKLDADPGDASWASTQVTRAANAVTGGVVVLGAAALAVVLFVLTVRGGKRR
jgi:hypothetical protein